MRLFLAGRRDELLLDHRHLLGPHLDAQVAAGHHDAVGHVEDLVEVRHRLGLLDLGDHRDAGAALGDAALQVDHVGGVPHERHRDQVDAGVDHDLEVRAVLGSDRRDAQADPRHVDALARGEKTAVLTIAWTSLPTTRSTATSIDPSSNRIRSPGLTSSPSFS